MDVVVEGAVAIPVLIEDAEGIAVGEVLKLNQAVHPVPAGRRVKKVSDDRIVAAVFLLTCPSRLA